jgi:hypothetical protein
MMSTPLFRIMTEYQWLTSPFTFPHPSHLKICAFMGVSYSEKAKREGELPLFLTGQNFVTREVSLILQSRNPLLEVRQSLMTLLHDLINGLIDQG